MQRPQSVPRLNTSKIRKLKHFPPPEPVIDTFNYSSRFKARKPSKRYQVLAGPDRDYGQKARPRTADTIKNFYSGYKKQKKSPPIWQTSTKYIKGYTGHIHGKHHIEGLNTVKSTHAALKRNFSAGDKVKINRRIHLGKRSKTTENPGQRFHIKGYAGFVRGSQHIAGRTFKNTTELALNTGVKELCSISPIPNDPHSNQKVENVVLQNSSPLKNYTGHLKGTRQIHGKTFLETYKSSNCLKFTALSRKRRPNRLTNSRFWAKNYAVRYPHQKTIVT